MVSPLGLALASLIGLSLGVLGGGGSVLTVPVLVYVVGFAAKPAIAMSLPVVGVTSLVGAVIHWRLGNVRVGMAALFGALTMIGAFAGARAAVFVSGALQLLLLSAVMLIAAALMFRRTRSLVGGDDRDANLGLLVPVALGVGLLTGIVGIGGGFLVVPALVLLAGVSMRQAVGTSLMVIAMNSASGFVGYLGSVSIDWAYLVVFTALALLGMLVGIAASRHVPQTALKRAFAVFLIVTGSFVLYQNRSVFAHGNAIVAATTSLPSR